MGNWFSCFSGRKPKHNQKTSNGDFGDFADTDYGVPVDRGHSHERRGNITFLSNVKNPHSYRSAHFPPVSIETDELLTTSPHHIASGNDPYTHSLISSNMTAAGSSATKKTTVMLNGTGTGFNEMTTTTGTTVERQSQSVRSHSTYTSYCTFFFPISFQLKNFNRKCQIIH